MTICQCNDGLKGNDLRRDEHLREPFGGQRTALSVDDPVGSRSRDYRGGLG